jgi:hypothetical protein
MNKSIRLLGTTLLVTGMGIGGTALTAGAASADTGTQSVTVRASSLDLTDKDKHKDRCWWTDSRGNGHDNRDDCDHNGDHKGDHNGDGKGDHKGDGKGDHKGDHNGDGNHHKYAI